VIQLHQSPFIAEKATACRRMTAVSGSDEMNGGVNQKGRLAISAANSSTDLNRLLGSSLNARIMI
jgi:hypothetical protein